jgi:uncharacterized membrane protein YfcA
MTLSVGFLSSLTGVAVGYIVVYILSYLVPRMALAWQVIGFCSSWITHNRTIMAFLDPFELVLIC